MKPLLNILIIVLIPFLLDGQTRVDSALTILKNNSNYKVKSHWKNFHKYSGRTTYSNEKVEVLHFINDSVVYDEGEKGFAVGAQNFCYRVFYTDSLIDCAWLDEDYFFTVWNFNKQLNFAKKYFKKETISKDTLIIELVNNDLDVRKIVFQYSDSLYMSVQIENNYYSEEFEFLLIPLNENVPQDLLKKMSQIIIQNKKIKKTNEFLKYHLSNTLFQTKIEEM